MLLSADLSLISYDLNTQSAAQIVIGLTGLVAAVLGIVIPLVILVIEFLGRDYIDIIDVYLARVGIVRVAIFSLAVLAFHGLVLFLTQVGFLSLATHLFYVTLLLLLLSSAVLLEVGFLLGRVRQSLSSDFLIRAFLYRLHEAVMESQREVVKYRYSRREHLNISRLGGLGKPFLGIRTQMVQGTVPLVASKSGKITDLHLPRWRKLLSLLSAQLNESTTESGYLVKLVQDTVRKGQTVLYVIDGEKRDTGLLQATLDRSLKIRGQDSGRKREIDRFLRQLKRMIVTAAQAGDDELFDRCLDIYLSIFQRCADLWVPPSDSPIKNVVAPGWPVMGTALADMESVIDAASQSKNDHLISSVARMLSEAVEQVINRSDEHVSESLRNVLRLFEIMYDSSRRHGNERGVQEAFSRLTAEVIDRYWLSKLKATYSEQEAVANLRRILLDILDCLSLICRLMIQHNDLGGLQQLLQRLQPDEFFARFSGPSHPVFSEVAYLQYQLQQALPEAAAKLQAEIAVREDALGMKGLVEDFFAELIFVAASHVFEGFERNEISSNRANAILDVLRPHFPNFSELLDLMMHLVESEGRSWAVFHRHPDTKQAFFADDEAKFYFFYCLRGAELTAQGKLPQSPPLADMESKLDGIEKACGKMTSNMNKWSDIIQADPMANIKYRDRRVIIVDFFELNRQMAQRFRDHRDEQIMSAELDVARISAFQGSFEHTRKSTPSLRSLLEQCGRVLHTTGLRGVKVRKHGRNFPKEYFTSLCQDSTYVEQLGQ